jgi:hypothetical protein
LDVVRPTRATQPRAGTPAEFALHETVEPGLRLRVSLTAESEQRGHVVLGKSHSPDTSGLTTDKGVQHTSATTSCEWQFDLPAPFRTGQVASERHHAAGVYQIRPRREIGGIGEPWLPLFPDPFEEVLPGDPQRRGSPRYRQGPFTSRNSAMTSKLKAALALALGLVAIAAPARAQLVITPTFDPSITSDPNATAIENTINSVITYYEGLFTNKIDVTIDFMKGGGLGGSKPSSYAVPYAAFRAALAAEPQTADTMTALAHLPISTLNPVTGTTDLTIKTADIRALGIAGSYPSTLPGGYDGIVTLNTKITNPGSPGTSGAYSLYAVVQHEIDEILGLGSALPTPIAKNPRPEDLYRYAANGARSLTTIGDNAYFSLNGTTRLVQFNQFTTAAGGDYGDWWSHNGMGNAPGLVPFTPIRVQDAFATPGSAPTLATDTGAVEIRALNVIGYTYTSGDVMNMFSALPNPQQNTFTVVLQGNQLANIAAQNALDPLINPFADYIQRFDPTGTSTITTSLDAHGNTDVVYTGPEIPSSYLGLLDNGLPHIGLDKGTPPPGGFNVLSAAWSDTGSPTVGNVPILSFSANPAAGPPDLLNAGFIVVFVEATHNGVTSGMWDELPFQENGKSLIVTLSNFTADGLVLSDAGYFISPTQIPLDDLNFSGYPPPGLAGSRFIPLLGLDGLTLGSGDSVSFTATPEPGGLVSLGVGLACLASFRLARRGVRRSADAPRSRRAPPMRRHERRLSEGS